MRLGLLPSQKRALDKAFKKARAFDTFRKRTRRTFLGLGLLAIGAGVGGFVLGRSWRSDSDDAAPATDRIRERWLAKLPWAQAYAEQPIGTLSANYTTFLMVIEQTGGDEQTWRGFAKLVEHSLSGASSDRYLKRMLLRTCAIAPPPEWLSPLVHRLAETR